MRRLFVALAALLLMGQSRLPPPPNYPPTPLVLTGFGDSTAQQGAINVPCSAIGFSSAPQCGIGPQANSVLGWVRAFSDGGYTVDYRQGYPGNVNGLFKVITTTAGNCTPNSTLTFTPNAPTGTPANQAGTFTLSFNAAGQTAVNQTIFLASPGSGYIAVPTYTVTGGSCTTQPILAYALSGTGDFGVAADQTSLSIWRIPDVCASTANVVLFSDGVNDLINSVALATTEANIQTMVNQLMSCGKRVILEAVQPVTSGTSGWNATMDKKRMGLNDFEAALCDAAAKASTSPSLVCVDSDKYLMDATSATGSPLATMTSDGVHPSVAGAQVRAIMILYKTKQWVGGGRFFPNSQQDLYDASNSPSGNLLGTPGLFLGAAGTVGTCTGTNATGWTQDWSGTGTMTCVGSQNASRQDGVTGQRQKFTLSDSAGGATDRIRLIEGFSTSNFTLGTDKVSLGVDIDVSNVTGAVEFIGCEAFETPSSGNFQGGLGLFGGNTAQAYPMLTSAQLAKMKEASILPDYGVTAAGSYRLNCETPPMLTQSTATSYNFYVYVIGGGTWTANLEFGNAYVRKNFQ